MITVSSNIRLPKKHTIVITFILVHLALSFYLVKLHQSCTVSDELVQQIQQLRLEIEYKANNTALNPTLSPANKEESKSYFAQDAMHHSQLLNKSYGPNTVYYIWCGKRWFEFPNYMSVKSVIKTLRPDSIVFLYDNYPIVDDWIYNTWFSELLKEFPFFRVDELSSKSWACNGHGKVNFEYINAILTDRGGFYVNEYTMLVDFPASGRSYDYIDAWDATSQTGFFYAKKGLPGKRSFHDISETAGLRAKKMTCLTDVMYPKVNRKTSCVQQTKPYFPKDIWNLENEFGKLVRNIFYGSSKIQFPQQSTENLIPNIAHVVWLGGGPMDFLFLLCILSLLHVAKVEAVYLHGDGPPTGPYWDLVKNNPRLHLIYRDHPGAVFDTPVNVVSHVTDIWRVDFMIKYGGIYVDTDVVFVRPLDDEIRRYDAVATYDWTYWNHPFPDTINFGVSIGKRNARFWHEFQKSMQWFIDKDWAWNGLRQPYRIKERHPGLLKVDPHLSVICFQSLCHPTWHPDYHNESVHHLNSNSIKDWRRDVYAFHWTLPTPYELLNHTTLLSSNSMFSEIGQFVLREASLLKYFKNLSLKSASTFRT